ncbi:SPOSA6832_02349, partial [Sporobolomyces salmonicolor]
MATGSRWGSLGFCSRCGTLLDLPGDDDHLTCDGCGQVEDATGANLSVSLEPRRGSRELIRRGSARATAYEGQVITTKSNPAAFPSSLRQLKTSLVKNRGDVEKKKVYVRWGFARPLENPPPAVGGMLTSLAASAGTGEQVDETCEKCGAKQMSVKTMQLRSAATVFYSCDKCGYQTRLNN